MLNPSFSKAMQRCITTPYVAPREIANRTVAGNEAFDTGGVEHRTQSVFGEEVWLKLERAGLSPKVFPGADVLEVCAGTGFLTYHLLQRCRPQHLTVNDISATELNLARQFIGGTYPDAPVDWVLGDMHTIDFGRQFDLIIGNSFIHHFHDVPKVLARFAAMLKPGGGIYFAARTHTHEHGGGKCQGGGLAAGSAGAGLYQRHCPCPLQGATQFH